MLLPHAPCSRTHSHSRTHTNTHLYPGGLLSHLLPLGLPFLRSQQIHWSLQVSLQSLFTAGYGHHPPSGTTALQLSLTPSLPACTDAQKYTCMSATLSHTLNIYNIDTHVEHNSMSQRHSFLTRVYLHIHGHTRTHTGSLGVHCSRLHAGLNYPPLFDWIYDCGSPFPISTDWLRANLSHQTPTEDKGGCGRRPVLNWNKFVMAATMYIFRIE